MSVNPFSTILAQSGAPGSTTACWKGAASLYHAYFTGLMLMIASRKGGDTAGEWIFRTFRRQHHEKFLSSFNKLGLEKLPDAVAAAQYHYLSNSVGGAEVEYMYEANDKVWVHFRHPRWMYDGTALCGAPLQVSHGFLRGWYGHNGVSLGNPRLGFVCTSQDMTAEYGLAGYFKEYDHDLEAEERLQFAPGEMAPPFDPDAAPQLNADAWPVERLHKANRNYAMEYIKTGLPELIATLGPGEASALGNLAANIIGRQFYGEVRGLLNTTGDSAMDFANFMSAMAAAQDDSAVVGGTDDDASVRISGWRLMRGRDNVHPAVFEAWNGLWQGCLAEHNRFLALQIVERVDYGDDAFEWRIRRVR
ncbi:MAG: hypothetical protein QGG19_16180 [Alphaproteobacteria bacterium]|jgi:hypothetical protein|nr:hypothetical protein [Alphaproteobacteria bacterium]MDP6257411.1 hypothetical protein [Alphaproteobacteria bacterium]MDP7056447.1 hypothetical protein [Alphaproteobacteria bacterium]MDP7230446.1 hypothetical protein [Alphaproteobacteria bacterium]MDP7459024.1 hypothetical protein [Alphaproteobacteria bacterium]|tara:strand:- start:5245 stop:6330 length:1086 start_codon:yes stop_codon:yes gene_type:complete